MLKLGHSGVLIRVGVWGMETMVSHLCPSLVLVGLGVHDTANALEGLVVPLPECVPSDIG